MDRSLLRAESAQRMGALGADALALFDRLSVPDGCPFVAWADGSLNGLDDLNRYLVEAVRQGALSARTARTSTAYHLIRLRLFVGARRDAPLAGLKDTTKEDLRAFRDWRRQTISAASWNTEIAADAAFFAWAVAAELIERSPVPRWGSNQRNTLHARELLIQHPKYLTEAEVRAFLDKGLRGDGTGGHPYAERDYAFGLTLVSTGLRREEAGLLLDVEIPTLDRMPSDGVTEFVRYGKYGRPRRVLVSDELVRAIDLYRNTVRSRVVAESQRALRQRRRNGSLLMVDDVDRDNRHVELSGQKIDFELLTNDQRSRLASIAANGTIEPLALFVTRFALPARLSSWNEIFDSANVRLARASSPERPPPSLHVTPHTLRHTFAVRMLAALMSLGRERHSDPYHLLASPLLAVQQLLGHASPETTQTYLHAALRYDELVPRALKEHVARMVTEPEP